MSASRVLPCDRVPFFLASLFNVGSPITAGIVRYLRAREILGLTWTGVPLTPGNGEVIGQTDTKGGQRTAASDTSFIVTRWLKHYHGLFR